jgi:hypothetical protein
MVLVTGSGVTAKVVEYYRRLNNQEIQLLNEQLRALKRAPTSAASAIAPMLAAAPAVTMSAMGSEKIAAVIEPYEARQKLIAKIEKRTREFVQIPACASISSLVMVEVAIATNAEPGTREIRLATPRGVSNPLVFHIGQLPEFSRKPMITAARQILGKEAQALRKRPAAEAEVPITVPCTVNGQIASGEVNRYRFEARKGRRLVISTQARQLIPYIADAVPGWFQPVLALYDVNGKELAFADDYRFKPDPVILFEVPEDGQYMFTITDAIYRGREDFVYRITIGELPFVTSLFPLGAKAGAPVTPKMKGWNLHESELILPAKDTRPGVRLLAANRQGFISNPAPFALDTLPECLENESNNDQAQAQKVTLPVIVNGRIDRSDDWDVFLFTGKSNDIVAVEVQARRLDSPLDSVIKLTDATGALLAFSDDREDLAAGVNTHHADSWFMAKLPADGAYFVHIGDTARKGGEEYGYRLHISAPQPDFALCVVPSSVSLRSRSAAPISIHAMRKDGFTGPIRLALKDSPPGFSAPPVTLSGTQTVARLMLRCDLGAMKEPANLSVVGSAKIGDKEIAHEAVPAEDRMQAFLWRHLVPASDLKVLVFNPAFQSPPRRIAPARPPPVVPTNAAVASVASAASAAAKPRFTQQQIAGRLRQLRLLFEEGLLTDDFYDMKVAECEAAR